MKRKKRKLSRSCGEISIKRETAYIIRKAKDRIGHMVIFGQILLFSTDTGDAWILYPKDRLALCLARDGDEQEYTVEDLTGIYKIHWDAMYDIKDDAFIIFKRDGSVATILGYPTEEIIKAARNTSMLREKADLNL